MHFFPYYRLFSIWLIALTVLFNLIGMISNSIAQVMSILILLPFMIAFFMMCKKYAKEQKAGLNKKQRWSIAMTCSALFWIYLILANLVGYLIQFGFNFQSLADAFSQNMIIILTIGVFFCVNAVLTGLGYYFLGKPLDMMIQHHHR
ncbi:MULTISPECIES: ABZJ_00895 family protein [unclassified Acinetobacter]|uniref:ABZJ_00895 family protein n=1 Tax=unclassified Acinetobacter TaxID=196816 RepID=UPI0035B88D8D